MNTSAPKDEPFRQRLLIKIFTYRPDSFVFYFNIWYFAISGRYIVEQNDVFVWKVEGDMRALHHTLSFFFFSISLAAVVWLSCHRL